MFFIVFILSIQFEELAKVNIINSMGKCGWMVISFIVWMVISFIVCILGGAVETLFYLIFNRFSNRK